ncbi:Lipid A export ATP-binding/permease protein MsbA [Rhizobium sp. UR51a]|nr:Lipid A export ATP-binding/permease protein MsbA [Rhizobium sp. UR51a]
MPHRSKVVLYRVWNIDSLLNSAGGSALDSESEAAIQEKLNLVMEGKR